MRLIDGDELFIQVCRTHDEFIGLDELAELMDKMPTIDAEPVRYGRWIEDKGLYRCSVCSNLWTAWWIVACPKDRMYKEMKYCPNCGAKMDEVKENATNRP